MKQVSLKIAVMESSINGYKDAIEFDNTCDVIGKSDVINMLNDLLKMTNNVQDLIKKLSLGVVSNNEAIEMKKLQKQHIVDIMQEDEKIGLYNEVAVCDWCSDYLDGYSDDITCDKCKRRLRL